MNRRAALLLLCLLPGSARADIADLHKPILAVWSAQVGPDGTSWCRHCDRFWEDYRENARFRESLKARFRVVYVNADRRRLEGTLLRGITALPTFDAAGRRVTGFTNESDLLERLGVPWVEPYQRSPETRPPAAQPPERSLPSLPPPVGDPPQIEPHNEPLVDSRPTAPVEPDVKPVESAPQEPADEQHQSTPAPAAGPGVSSAPVAPQSGGSWVAGAATTVGGLLWGPAGAAAASIATGAISWIIARRKRPAGGTLPEPVEASVPARDCLACGAYRDRLALLNRQITEEREQFTREMERIGGELEAANAEGAQTETRFVRVPVSDDAGEAYREAIRRVAELNPRAVSLLNQLESTAAQLLHGRKAKRGDAVPESKPGLWSDQED